MALASSVGTLGIRGVFLLVSVGSAATTLAAGCLFPSFDGMEGAPQKAEERVTGQHTASDAGGGGDPDVAVPENAPPVLLPDAGDAGDLGCSEQDVTWTVDAASCSAPSGTALEAGAQLTLDDHDTSDPGKDTGKVTVTCSGGALVPSSAVCEPPRKFNLSSASACGNGFCMGVTPGQCGVPSPDRAKAICVKKGYVDQTGFDTSPSTPGTNLCLADGVTCAVTANGPCNIIFTAVFCRH
jgi:hypothetical protein